MEIPFISLAQREFVHTMINIDRSHYKYTTPGWVFVTGTAAIPVISGTLFDYALAIREWVQLTKFGPVVMWETGITHRRCAHKPQNLHQLPKI